jgi:hypothetical protein
VLGNSNTDAGCILRRRTLSKQSTGIDFIGTYIDDDTLRMWRRATAILSVSFVCTGLLGAAVLFADRHAYGWDPANRWPAFLAMYIPLVLAMVDGMALSVWLVLHGAMFLDSKKHLRPFAARLQRERRNKRRSA